MPVIQFISPTISDVHIPGTDWNKTKKKKPVALSSGLPKIDGPVLRGVAFEGADVPEVKGLKDIDPYLSGTPGELKDVEIFMTGSWKDGEIKADVPYLQKIVDNTNKLLETNTFEPPFKQGHPENQKEITGLPALGWVKKLKLAGNKILADLKDVPEIVMDVIKRGLYKKISAEIYPQWPYNFSEGNNVMVVTFTENELKGETKMKLTKEQVALICPSCAESMTAEFIELSEADVVKFSGLLKDMVNPPASPPAEPPYEWGTDEKKIPPEEMKESMPKLAKKLAEYKEVEKYAGNTDALIDWVGKVGYNGCINSKSVQESSTDPAKLCGWLKGQARDKGVLAPEHMNDTGSPAVAPPAANEDLKKKEAELLKAQETIAQLQEQVKVKTESETKLQEAARQEKIKKFVEANKSIITPAIEPKFRGLIENFGVDGVIKFSENGKDTSLNKLDYVLSFCKDIADARVVVFQEMLKGVAPDKLGGGANDVKVEKINGRQVIVSGEQLDKEVKMFAETNKLTYPEALDIVTANRKK